MPTAIDRLFARWGFSEEEFRRVERVMRVFGVVFMVLTGLFFIVWPPMSTHALWGGDWPPVAWGFFMVLGGVVSLWGILSRVLQVEQTGKFIMGLSIGFYIFNQSLIMFDVPITPTRAGGTGILVAYFFAVWARYFGIGADIIASRTAKILEGR